MSAEIINFYFWNGIAFSFESTSTLRSCCFGNHQFLFLERYRRKSCRKMSRCLWISESIFTRWPTIR